MAARYTPIVDPDVVTTSLYLPACYLRISLMLDQGATAWATGGVTGIYTWPLPEIREFRKNETIAHISAVSYFKQNCKYSFLKTLDCGTRRLSKISLSSH